LSPIRRSSVLLLGVFAILLFWRDGEGKLRVRRGTNQQEVRSTVLVLIQQRFGFGELLFSQLEMKKSLRILFRASLFSCTVSSLSVSHALNGCRVTQRARDQSEWEYNSKTFHIHILRISQQHQVHRPTC